MTQGRPGRVGAWGGLNFAIRWKNNALILRRFNEANTYSIICNTRTCKSQRRSHTKVIAVFNFFTTLSNTTGT